jgi:hypothetical protein
MKIRGRDVQFLLALSGIAYVMIAAWQSGALIMGGLAGLAAAVAMILIDIGAKRFEQDGDNTEYLWWGWELMGLAIALATICWFT